jgi:hypothetical protein
MIARNTAVVVGGFLLATACAAHQVLARQESLLNVSQGQIPNDTGSDGATTMTIKECKELGGKALKVVFAKGDSFGDRQARVANWKQFISLQFNAFNPSQQKVALTLAVKHNRTTSYQTRADYPFSLNPGKNEVKIGIDELTNVNGSAPELSAVGKWYFACAEGESPTLYFSGIELVGDDLPAARAAGGAVAETRPAPTYRIQGMIGRDRVDLTATPQSASTAVTKNPSESPAATRSGRALPEASRHAVGSDPARLVRIRAAKMPPITRPVLFCTPEADAICSALEVFPADNPWNQVVSAWPVHPNSKNIIASIGGQKSLRYNPDMGFILVPAGQPRVEVKIVDYPGESDKGPFPVPENTPIENWPGPDRDKSPTLDSVQRDVLNQGGDRHASVVDPVNRMLYEFYQMKKTDRGWQAAQCSIFDLKSNQLRPDGWTSTDAAGLPIFPATVRYDEIRRGVVEHAMRVTVVKTRRAYVAPATHFASPHVDENLPRMGERIRLKQDVDISGFSPEVQAILKGLKKYGMFVADNGIDWAISVAPDPRIPLLHEELRKIKGSAFEVVVPPQ